MISYLPKIVSFILILLSVWNISELEIFLGFEDLSLTINIIIINILMWIGAFILFIAIVEEEK